MPTLDHLTACRWYHSEYKNYDLPVPKQNDWLRLQGFSWYSQQATCLPGQPVPPQCQRDFFPKDVGSDAITLTFELRDQEKPTEWRGCSITMERNNCGMMTDSSPFSGYWVVSFLSHDSYYCGQQNLLFLKHPDYPLETTIQGIYELLNLPPPPAPK